MRITILFVLAILSLYIDKNIPDTTFAGFEDDIDYSFSLDTNEQRLALLNLYNMTSNSQWNNNWDTSSTMFNFWGVCYDTPTGSPYCLCNTPCVPAIACVSTIDMDGTWSTINCCGPDHLGDGCSQGGGNNLEGTLPENINLPQLKRLILSFNNLNGEIPDFQGIENLEWLVLSCNSFNSIADFQNLPKLTELYIYKNFLNSLPNFSNLGSLEKLLAHRNEISGTIPNFEALFNLRELRLYGNKFEGTIPEFQNSPLLADLRIYENNFTFEDFLPNWDALCNISNVKADTMNLAFESIIYSDIPDSCSFEIDLSFDDTVSSNVYYWFKDGIPFDTIYGNNKLSFSKISLADDGVYSCRITNDTVTPKFDLVLETGAITVNVCESGKLSIDTVLCIGDSLKVNGITYNENNLEGKQILPGSSINGCDSILWINISYLEEAEAGPENIISCQDSIFLMTNLPDFTNGEWTTNSSANIQNPFNPDTWVYQLEEGSFEFYWTLIKRLNKIFESA